MMTRLTIPGYFVNKWWRVLQFQVILWTNQGIHTINMIIS